MFELPIVSRQARDLVEGQFGSRRDERGPVTKRRVRPARRKRERSAVERAGRWGAAARGDRETDILPTGGGVASANAAAVLREEGFDGSILIVGRELDPP